MNLNAKTARKYSARLEKWEIIRPNPVLFAVQVTLAKFSPSLQAQPKAINHAAVARLPRARTVEAPVRIASLAITFNTLRDNYCQDICKQSERLFTYQQMSILNI